MIVLNEFFNVLFAAISAFILGMAFHSAMGHVYGDWLRKKFHMKPLLNQEDYRGLIAVLFSIFFGCSVLLLILLDRFDYLQTVTIVFGLPLSSLLGFYFGAKEK